MTCVRNMGHMATCMVEPVCLERPRMKIEAAAFWVYAKQSLITRGLWPLLVGFLVCWLGPFFLLWPSTNTGKSPLSHLRGVSTSPGQTLKWMETEQETEIYHMVLLSIYNCGYSMEHSNPTMTIVWHVCFNVYNKNTTLKLIQGSMDRSAKEW